MKKIIVFILLLVCLTACGIATPLPSVPADAGAKFTLAPGQSALINGADFEITFIGVAGDGRCPLLIECAMSGPVTVTISIKSGADVNGEFQLTTFTDNDGSVPPMDFEGMTPQVELNGYSIRLASLLPFPQRSVAEIRDDEYRAAFVVSK